MSSLRRKPARCYTLATVYQFVYNGVVTPISIVVDRASAEPVYEQIARQIRALIASTQLASGSALPSVRRLASDLGVNLNTVARAYRILEEDGFVEIREREGARIAPASPRAAAASRESMRMRLRDLLTKMSRSGMGRGEIERLTRSEIASLDDDK